mmetsp:Transcript_20994/g.37557  ORF Transcript_20994/g.37557 Transcript_20994/m.37557 type:complete len:81 (+) Transcript_20994:1750-1992(+)
MSMSNEHAVASSTTKQLSAEKSEGETPHSSMVLHRAGLCCTSDFRTAAHVDSPLLARTIRSSNEAEKCPKADVPYTHLEV